MIALTLNFRNREGAHINVKICYECARSADKYMGSCGEKLWRIYNIFSFPFFAVDNNGQQQWFQITKLNERRTISLKRRLRLSFDMGFLG